MSLLWGCSKVTHKVILFVARSLSDGSFGILLRGHQDWFYIGIWKAQRPSISDSSFATQGPTTTGADTNAADTDGETPLHAAALQKGPPQVVRLMLAAGADVNAATGLDNMPLHLAAYAGDA